MDNPIIFALKTGANAEDLQNNHGLAFSEAESAVSLWLQGNTTGLDSLLATVVPANTPSMDGYNVVQETPEKPTYGYSVEPRSNYVFVKPLPKEHPGRLITPPAYESASDMGFVHASGVPDINLGDLVLYDKYSTVGNIFEFIEDGEIVEMAQVRGEFITAKLRRQSLEK